MRISNRIESIRIRIELIDTYSNRIESNQYAFESNRYAFRIESIRISIRIESIRISNRIGTHSNRIGTHSNRIGTHSNRIGTHSNRIGTHSNRIGTHSNRIDTHFESNRYAFRIEFLQVTAVAVNDASGDIATASGASLFVWTLNGVLLAVVNTAESGGIFSNPSSVILCVAFSTHNEWDAKNVVMCGTSDGLVKIYGCELSRQQVN